METRRPPSAIAIVLSKRIPGASFGVVAVHTCARCGKRIYTSANSTRCWPPPMTLPMRRWGSAKRCLQCVPSLGKAQVDPATLPGKAHVPNVAFPGVPTIGLRNGAPGQRRQIRRQLPASGASDCAAHRGVQPRPVALRAGLSGTARDARWESRKEEAAATREARASETEEKNRKSKRKGRLTEPSHYNLRTGKSPS